MHTKLEQVTFANTRKNIGGHNIANVTIYVTCFRTRTESWGIWHSIAFVSIDTNAYACAVPVKRWACTNCFDWDCMYICLCPNSTGHCTSKLRCWSGQATPTSYRCRRELHSQISFHGFVVFFFFIFIFINASAHTKTSSLKQLFTKLLAYLWRGSTRWTEVPFSLVCASNRVIKWDVWQVCQTV